MANLPDLTMVTPVLEAEADAGEEAGRLTPAAIHALRHAGLFALHQPADLGGLGLPLPDACRVIAAVAEADGAAGWASMIGAGSAWFAGRMDPEGASQVFGGGGAVAGSGKAGRAEQVGAGAWRIHGRWRWCSGAPWAEWFTFNAIDPEGAVITVALPEADVRTHPNTWDVRGLRATASWDVSVDGAVVPGPRAFRVTDDPPVRPEPVFRLGFETFAQATMAAVPVGLARRAMTEVVRLVQDRTPAPGTGRATDDRLVRYRLATIAASVSAAAAGLDRATARSWDAVESGAEPDPAVATELRLAAVHAANTGTQIVSELGALASMSALDRSSVLGRVLADVVVPARNALLSDIRLAETDPVDLPSVLHLE